MFYLEVAIVVIAAIGIGALLLVCIDYFINSDEE